MNKKEIYSNSSFLKKKVLTLLNTNKSELLNYINTVNDLKFFENQLVENLPLMERFDSLFFEIKPIITLNYMDNMKRELLNFSIIDFNKTKQFYVDLFECVGREINVLIGLRNIEINKDFNNLNIAQFNKIKNFHDCITSSNGNKKQFLEKSSYYPLIKDVFDHKLRNGVGHYKCQLDLKTMEVEYYPYTDDIEKSKRESISYIDFIFKLYSLFNLFISLMYLKAVLYSIYFASKSKTSLCLKDVSLKVDKKHPLICLTYYWNGTNYTWPEIIKHDFIYWNFTDIYANFNLCKKDSTHIVIDFDSDFIIIKINQTNIYKFKIDENRRWLKSLTKADNFGVIKQMAESIIPLFNVKPAF
ncbi:MAG: hypothetical protein MPEBLZ_01456 [Candidatus Methanoperedens nitroreducens]|uniref:Uncharacterized protein n=1 Tax=Candidatus Methanoperedens nitratireducens TaxID=1392998 RepID=A0A0P8ABG8_9EURY|nr:MAG: hypothetical protein MPEBLZ_01456 [Candidatus Methanoperedens sp. BLZ1]